MEGQMYGNVLYRWMMWMMLFCHGICMVQYDPNESRKRCCAEVFLYGWVNLKPSLNTHSPKTCDVGAKICGNGSWQNSVAQIVRSKDKSDLRIMLSLDKLFLVLWFGTLNAEWELCKNCLNRDAFGGHFCGCFFWGVTALRRACKGSSNRCLLCQHLTCCKCLHVRCRCSRRSNGGVGRLGGCNNVPDGFKMVAQNGQIFVRCRWGSNNWRHLTCCWFCMCVGDARWCSAGWLGGGKNLPDDFATTCALRLTKRWGSGVSQFQTVSNSYCTCDGIFVGTTLHQLFKPRNWRTEETNEHFDSC